MPRASRRNAYCSTLMPHWLPALDGVVEQLEAGERVDDVGYGERHSTDRHLVALSQAATPPPTNPVDATGSGPLYLNSV
jgi:hypothetical protein